MQSPLLDTDTLFEKFLQELPPDLAESAKEFKAFTRSRKLKTPQDVLRAVLLYSGLDQSLREVAGTMTLLVGCRITDEAISKRLAATRAWVKVLLERMLGLTDEVLRQNPEKRLVVVDASQVTGVQASGSEYVIHVKLDLIRFELIEVIVTDAKTSESLVNFSYAAGDIVVGDRAYIRRKRILDLQAKAVDVIGRFSPTQCIVKDSWGKELDWQIKLKSLGRGEQLTVEVKLDDGKREARRGWIHIYRKTEQDAAQARRKAKRKAQQDGRKMRELTLYLCDYVMVYSTVSETILSGEVVMKLYRVRWQIEILFKRWKSLLGAANLRTKQMSELGWSWLYGKLLYCLIIERRAGRILGWEKLAPDREQTLWRIWKIVQSEVCTEIIGIRNWKEQMWVEAIEVLGERKRKRRLQSLPKEIHEYLERALGRDEEEC